MRFQNDYRNYIRSSPYSDIRRLAIQFRGLHLLLTSKCKWEDGPAHHRESVAALDEKVATMNVSYSACYLSALVIKPTLGGETSVDQSGHSKPKGDMFHHALFPIGRYLVSFYFLINSTLLR